VESGSRLAVRCASMDEHAGMRVCTERCGHACARTATVSHAAAADLDEPTRVWIKQLLQR